MMARFHRSEMHPSNTRGPAWLVFIWEVNGVLPGTFDACEHEEDKPFPGYETERYPGARVIHGLDPDEGVRIVADTPEVTAAFRTAATNLGVQLSDASTQRSRRK